MQRRQKGSREDLIPGTMPWKLRLSADLAERRIRRGKQMKFCVDGKGKMELSKYDEKHVRLTTVNGETCTGIADYYPAEYCLQEYGEEEEGVSVEGTLVYASQIMSIEEAKAHGTVELRTERLILRRYRSEDAQTLYETLGCDPSADQYSGWNPYAAPEMARETVSRFINSYGDEHFYGWVLDYEGVLCGTIGAYDYEDDRIEVGFSIVKDWRGRGFATEALRAVLAYLTENEKISCVRAWCASANTGSRRVLEKAGMQYVCTEKESLVLGENKSDRRIYTWPRSSGE